MLGKLRRLLIFSVIFLALLLMLMRVGLLYLEQHKSLLEQRISLATGSPVTIGSVHTNMHRWQPQIQLQQVTVLDPEHRQALLTLGDLRLGLSVFSSVFTTRVQLAWVHLSRAQISVTRSMEGQISIAGLKNKSDRSPDWLLDIGVLTLAESEIKWVDQQHKLPDQIFSQINASLFKNSRGFRNSGSRGNSVLNAPAFRDAGASSHHSDAGAWERVLRGIWKPVWRSVSGDYNYNHQLSIALTLPDAQQPSLQLLANLHGHSLTDLHSYFYFQGKQINLPQWLGDERLSGYQVATGQADFQVWGDTSRTESSALALSGNINLAGLAADYQADSTVSKQDIALTRLATRFQWLGQANSWQLDTDELVFEMNGQSWPGSAISLHVTQASNNHILQAQAVASFIDLQDISRLLFASHWSNNKPVQALKSLSVHGKVQNLSVTYDAQAAAEHRLSVCGDIQQLAFEPWKNMPGASNLTGRLCGNSAQGTMDLATREGALNWPGVFRKAIDLTALQGRLSWQVQAGQWRLGSEALTLETPDLISHHRFHLRLPEVSDHDHQPHLDWDGTFTQGRVSAVKHYLPIKELKPKLLSWLDQAFVSGQVTEGRGLFTGPLRKFPFKQDEGLFEMTFRVGDGELNYGSKWPNVTELEAQVGFHNNSLQVDVISGRVSDAEIQSAQVAIPTLDKQAQLTLKGTVLGKLEQGVSFVRTSPLVNVFEPVLEVITPTGNAKLDLQLKIPLAQPDATEINGTTYLLDSRVNISALDLTLNKLKGAFRFDRHGLESNTIHAMAFAEPIQIDLQHNENTQSIHILGVCHSRELVRYYQPLAELAEGTLPYRLEARIPWRQTQTDVATEVELNSSLQGLTINMPAPLGKTGNDARHFHATLAFPDAETMPLTIKYGNALAAELDLYHSEAGVQLYGGTLGLGVGSVVKRSGQQGLSVSANLNTLDLQQWQGWSKNSASGQQASGSGASLKSIDFRAQQINWGDQHWGPVSLNAQRKATVWSGSLDADEIKGKFKYETITQHRRRAKLSLDLEHLKLSPASDKTAHKHSGQQAVDADGMDPLVWPDLEIKSAQLYWKSSDLGAMELKTHRQAQVLMIDHFNIFDDNHHQLAGSGNWSVQNGQVRTQLQGKLDFMDMGNLLARLDWAGHIEETRGQADFNFNWMGPPNRPLLDTLVGKFSLSLNKGRLISVGPGLGRVLGVLNIDTLKRRLMLDFSDLFEQGFAYDGVVGAFDIDAGIAVTNDFTVDGIAAALDVRGQLRLPSRTLDLGVQVTPKTSVTLPLAGALAGGPAVGAAVLVAQQLLGDQVDSITSTRYTVTGDWRDPVTTRLKGQGGVLDKVWSGFTDFSDQQQLDQ